MVSYSWLIMIYEAVINYLFSILIYIKVTIYILQTIYCVRMTYKKECAV